MYTYVYNIVMKFAAHTSLYTESRTEPVRCGIVANILHDVESCRANRGVVAGGRVRAEMIGKETKDIIAFVCRYSGLNKHI